MTEITIPAPRRLELPVPHAWRGIVGVGIGSLLTIAFLGGFLALAINNLLHFGSASWIALAASLVWLLLVTVVLGGFCYEAGGPVGWFTRMLGEFAPRQFIRIEQSDSADPIVTYGYGLLGRNFHYRKIDVHGITGVGWCAGQVSHMSGRDADDWTVDIWYESSAVRSERTPSHRTSGEELDIVGDSGSRESAEQLGQALVDLLLAAGAKLEANPEGRKQFVRSVPSPLEGEG